MAEVVDTRALELYICLYYIADMQSTMADKCLIGDILTRHMGHPTPTFKQTSEFVLTFYKAPEMAAPGPKLQQRETLWGEYAEQKPDEQTSTVLNAQEARLTRAMQYVQEHGSIANKVYRELTGVSDRTATRDLETLVERGRLRSIGKRRSRHYEPS